jgi:gliding motility-associated-like protein
VGDNFNLADCDTGGSNQTNFIQLQNPQSFALSDDAFTSVINIGFNFDFYGNSYNQLIAGDNGIVSFNISQANGYCSWVATPLPSATPSAMNAILIPWQDLYMPAGGTIQTETIGTAPNRVFVLYYDGLSLFSTSCQTPDQCFTGSLLLFEGSNKIETHISNKTTCASWGSGTAAHGLNNATGTIADIIPGRNNTVWTAQNDSWEFIPSGVSNYIINQIPFITVASPNGSGLVWGDTQGNSYPYNNGVLNTTVQNGITGYFLSSSTCGSGVGSVSDTAWVTGLTSQVNAVGIDDICSAGLGSVTATPLAGIPPYTYNWPTLGVTNPTVSNVIAGTYQVEMTDGNGCLSTANVTIGDTPAAFQGTTTVISCPGGSDGTATAEMIPVLGNITYQWDAAAGNQTTQTAIALTAGQYTCLITSDIGCTGNVVVDVTEIPGMIGTIAIQSDVTCNSGNNGIIEVSVSLGTAPYTYSWDNSVSTTNIANDLFAGTHTVTITDANGCTIDVTGTIGEPSPLTITSLTPDTQICPEDDITLSVTGTGGSSPYTYTWYENGIQIGTGIDIIVDPVNTNTQYCIELSETCGSPIDQECNLIYFPTPIIPSALPDETEKCLPGAFTFVNTSSNSGEIATTFWEFGDQLWALENGPDTTSHTYGQVGTFDVTLTVTSIYGCVYTDTLFSLVEVKPNPIADFTFSSNPTTIFNTSVQMQNASSVDAIYHDWYSPFSNPAFSSSEDPWLTFPAELGTYPITLIVETERGCTDTTTLELNIVDDIIFYAPNTFTPDGDEYNQNWRTYILGIDVYQFELYIFNRWGELMWESHNPEESWDGTYHGMPVQDGTYTWVARVKSLHDDNKLDFNGYINIIR